MDARSAELIGLLVANEEAFDRTGSLAAWEAGLRDIMTAHNEGHRPVIKEALEYLRGVLAERQPQVLKPAGEPDHVYYLTENGRYVRTQADPRPRAHQVRDLASLAALCHFHATPQAPASVWYSREGVVALLDDGTRRDRVTLGLRASPQMRKLAEWGASPDKVPWQDQATLVRTLRGVFGGAFGGASPVEAFRRVRFKRGEDGEKVIEHGRSSIGKSLEARLLDAERLPEELAFYVPAFEGDHLGVWVTVRCLVEVDPKEERFAVVPEAGAVEGAWLRAEERLGEALREALGTAWDGRWARRWNDPQGAVPAGPFVEVYQGAP
jgi:hypothetical protein